MEKTSIDLIVFDLDGTLADTMEDVVAAANYACRRLKLPEHPAAVLKDMIGGGEETFVRRIIGQTNAAYFDEAMSLYLDYYSRHYAETTRLYPGVEETLEALAGKKLAVLSNKREDLARLVVKAMGIARFFQAVRGGDSFGVLKPAPEGLLRLMRELGTSARQTLMVGDKPADIKAGRAAGAHTVAVTYGYGDLGHLTALSPDLIIDRLIALQDLLS